MNVLTIARRDLGAYFSSYGTWFVIAAILFIDGVIFNAFAMGGSARYSHEVLEDFFYFSSGTTMIAGILLTMGSLAEERSKGTDALLRTSTARDGQVVLGKYIASMSMLAVLVLLTAYMPGLIFVNGKVSLAHIAVGYLGLLSIGSAVVAIGIFGSSLFKSQLLSGAFSGVIVVGMLIAWLVSQISNPPFSAVAEYTALFDQHFQPFMEGRLLSSGVVYYGSLTFAFLLGATRVLQGRRWE